MPTLKQPEQMLDFLLPAGREKFRLNEVAEIFSVDAGKPMSVQSLRNGIESGAIFATRFNFSAKPGECMRHRMQWMLRGDVLLALLEYRTAPEECRVQKVLEIISTFSREALDMVVAHAVAAQAKCPVKTPKTREGAI